MHALSVLRRHFPKVETIEDAKSPVVVNVSPKDNTKGTPGDLGECALARACERELKVDGAYIGLGTSYVIKGHKAIRYRTPQSVAREITSFDRGSDFQPGTYSLGTFGPSDRLGSKKGGASAKSRGILPKRRAKVHKTARVRKFA